MIGSVNLIRGKRDEARGTGWVCCGLCEDGNAGDLGPGLEGLGPGGAILGGGEAVTTEGKEVVDPIMGRKEALDLAGGLEGRWCVIRSL